MKKIKFIIKKPQISGRYLSGINKGKGCLIYTVSQFLEEIHDGSLLDDDGFGYWAKNNYKSEDDVFSTPKLDATHVVWYSK